MATTSPPRTPGPGPKSMIVSAASIVSSSCSTTTTVLPRSRNWASVASSRSLSRGCRPIEGSSKMYSTPTRPQPICPARRMRCDSPPDRVGAVRARVRYSSPTLSKKPSRPRISFSTSAAITARVSSSSRSLKNSVASAMLSAQTSVSERAGRSAKRGCRVASVTVRACSLRRAPAQATQPTTRMYFSNCRRCMPLWLVRYFDNSSGMMPVYFPPYL